jgi:hypothetical protein
MKFFATLPFAVAVLSAVSVSAVPAPVPVDAAPAADTPDAGGKGGKGGGAADIITAVIDLGITIAKALTEGVQGDKDARSEFTQKLASETRSK